MKRPRPQKSAPAHTGQTGQFDHITDPELRKKLEGVAAEHTKSAPLPREVEQAPKFVFSRQTPERQVGATVRVRNGLDDEPRGGTIAAKVGRAYEVRIGGGTVIVHEADDSWPPETFE